MTRYVISRTLILMSVVSFQARAGVQDIPLQPIGVGIAGVATAAVIHGYGDRVVKQNVISSRDAAALVVVGSAFAARGFYIRQSHSTDSQAVGAKVLSQAVALPAGIAVGSFVFTQRFNNLVRRVPFIGSRVACSSAQCSGVCNECKGIKGALFTGVSTATEFVVSAGLNSLNSKSEK